jgi:hypothetical protein
MERNPKGIVRLEEATGVDLSDGVGLAVGIDASETPPSAAILAS